jgi:hypothetical protein
MGRGVTAGQGFSGNWAWFRSFIHSKLLVGLRQVLYCFWRFLLVAGRLSFPSNRMNFTPLV